MRNFFISYNRMDRLWAEWIAWQLEEAGYTTMLQAWDFRPGTNFVLAMHQAAVEAERTIAVLSPNYLDSHFAKPEWAAAFAQDPTGEKGLLLPVRVRTCNPKGLLPQIVYIDLVGLDEEAARDILLTGISRERSKPTTAPSFPGVTQRIIPLRPRFPQEIAPANVNREHQFVEITFQEHSNDAEHVAFQSRDEFHAVTSLFRLEVGAMDPNSPFYLKRSADHDIDQQLKLGGTTIIIKGPRQFGKSSLLARAHAAANQKGYLSCYLDFQSIDERSFESLDQLCSNLAWKITDELLTSIEPSAVWGENRGAKDNLTRFVEKALLSKTESRVQILLDEADRVFSYPSCRDEFFAMVRVWHNRRATHDNRGWRRLDILIAHSTDPALWIHDINQSPFNVGYRVQLDDFTLPQIALLNERHGNVLKTDTEIHKLTDLVGGHPFLVHAALYTLATKNCSVADLRYQATNSVGPFASHMRRHLQVLEEDKILKEALLHIMDHGKCKEETHFQRLWSAGLIRGSSRDSVQIRCQLYFDYLKKHL
jgi:hypothetical protein